MSLFDKHSNLIHQAIEATYSRKFFVAYPEHPKSYSETGIPDATNWFNNLKNNHFTELSQNGTAWIGDEKSPYTNEDLNIKYPQISVSDLIENAEKGYKEWKNVPIEDRAGLLVECLENIKLRFFDIAHATMHTTGQSWMMSFQASGPHGNDRALESIALGYDLISKFTNQVEWIKPMGKSEIKVQKSWKALGKGISLVIGCSTFPVWNSVPGIFASLITGNSVIVKPHPMGILSIAIVVAEIQKTLLANKYSTYIIQLAVDEVSNPITKILAEDNRVKLLDYTGNSSFGNYIESISGKTSFTEKAGVNSIIVDSTNNIQSLSDNIAFASSLYSGQMCTAPQNIFVSKQGVKTEHGTLPYDDFVFEIKKSVENISTHPKMGSAVLGAIQNPNTKNRVQDVANRYNNHVLDSHSIQNEEFPNALTASPLIIEIDSSKVDDYSSELFGPILLIIKTKDISESIKLASDLAKQHGAISSGAYTTDDKIKSQIKDAMEEAFTPVSFNMVGQIFMNQNAAFSDFHVTGGNAAGNASFTDQAYISKRFVWVGHKEVI